MLKKIKHNYKINKVIFKKSVGQLNKQNWQLFSTANYDEFAPGYVPKVVENDKYKIWETTYDKKINNGKQFTMIMPPPNITGTLHLGHALTLSIQDVLVRWYKMLGYNCTWVPGLDHAGIATQVVVERQIWQQIHKTRHEIGREGFLQEVERWRNIKSADIRRQIRNLGAVPDWDKEFFTMDQQMSRAVNEAFIRLFDSGLVYRSDYIINWSCVLQSAISDIEVDHKLLEGRTKVKVPGYDKPMEFGTLTKFAYKVCDEDREVIVSTTRPETILGDVAVAVHPDDERYANLRGKYVIHPFRRQPIPVIFDKFVDPTFGTGAVKITPAHDPVDFSVGKHHNLDILQVFNDAGCISIDCSGSQFVGMKRFDAREIIIQKLAELGLLRSVEEHSMTLPVCSRSGDVIEHMIKPQWFVNCTKMAVEAANDVREGRLKIQPPDFEKVWFNWLENIKDWCISRQLWWGHRIPAYSCSIKNSNESKWVSALSIEEAQAKGCALLGANPQEIVVTQDEDVLDTWFSSALLPFSAFGWPKQPETFSNFYPTSVLETGHDILFFWVARMVMLGKTLTGQLPFEKILLHGVICDTFGRKMSKSLGNVIAPEQVIQGRTFKDLQETLQQSHESGFLSKSEYDKALEGQRKMFPNGIPECGADALRFTLLSHNIQSHFINFDVNECYTNKLFCNKIWQAVKYTRLSYEKIAKTVAKWPTCVGQPALVDKWIFSRLFLMVNTVKEALERQQFHVAVAALKQFFYYEFCDVYLETTKPSLKAVKNSEAFTHVETLTQCLESGLQMLAPFMPHICEELYRKLPTGTNVNIKDNKLFQFKELPNYRDEELESDFQIALDAVTAIRRLKKVGNLTAKDQPKACIITNSEIFSNFLLPIQTLSTCEVKLSPNSDQLKNTKTLSDTVGNYGILHVLLPKQKDSSKIDNSSFILKKKIDKIVDDVRKMEEMMKSDGYKTKAREEVRIGHSKKLASLKEELRRLQQLYQP